MSTRSVATPGVFRGGSRDMVPRKTTILVAAILAALLAPVGGTGSVQAAGGTYRIVTGGNAIIGWWPDSGAIDQTSTDPLSAAGTLVSAPPQGAIGTADYGIEAGPGVVRARIAGSFTVPSNLNYPFTPTMQAVSTTELTVSGPFFELNTSVNIHVDGIIETPVCGSGTYCGAMDVQIQVGPFWRVSEFDTLPETRANQLGLTFDPVPGGYRVHGDVTSAPFGVRANTPVDVGIVLSLSGSFSGSSAPSTLGGSFDDPAARYQVSFAPTGPVLNDIPAGYTVTGPDVTDNHWTDPFAPPEPTDTTPPAVVGVPDRAPNIFGWYRAPVTIDWQATDDSGVASDPPDTLVDTDNSPGSIRVIESDPSCDPSGNCARGDTTIALDQVPPVVTCREAPVFELATNSIAFLDAFQSDTLSGSADTTPGVGVDISSAGQKTVEITGEDFAGNTTTVSCPYSVVDTTDTTLPVVTVPADIVTDATGPVGAHVTYAASASDAVDPSPTLVCAPASGGTFPIGTTTVTCTATDAAGNSASGSFTVHVRSAREQIVRLIDRTLAFLGLPALRAAFRASLQAAADALSANHPRAACLALDLYSAGVRLAPARAFTAAEKAQLIADATRTRAVIGCN